MIDINERLALSRFKDNQNVELHKVKKHLEICYLESLGYKKIYSIQLDFYNIVRNIIQFQTPLDTIMIEYDNEKDLMEMSFGFGLANHYCERHYRNKGEYKR